MSNKEYCIDTVNFEGKRVVFEEINRKKKAEKRPELLDAGILNRIVKNLKDPDFVYLDYANPDLRCCYYREEYQVNSKPRYLKVVVTNGNELLYVVTAYRPDEIKELKYNLKPIWEKK